MSWHNREQLETALKAGKIFADEGTISHLDKFLYVLEHVYSLPSRHQRPPPGYKYLYSVEIRGPSKKLKQLGKALREWIEDDSKTKVLETDIIQAFNPPGPVSIERRLAVLSKSVSDAITWLELASGNMRQKQQVETAFFIDLHRKYIELSGKRGFSDDGPAVRFMTECAAILEMPVPQGLRRRVQQATLARQKKPPPSGPPPDFSAVLASAIFFSEGGDAMQAFLGVTANLGVTAKPPEEG